MKIAMCLFILFLNCLFIQGQCETRILDGYFVSFKTVVSSGEDAFQEKSVLIYFEDSVKATESFNKIVQYDAGALDIINSNPKVFYDENSMVSFMVHKSNRQFGRAAFNASDQLKKMDQNSSQVKTYTLDSLRITVKVRVLKMNLLAAQSELKSGTYCCGSFMKNPDGKIYFSMDNKTSVSGYLPILILESK